MHLGGKTQQRSRVTLPLAIALVAFAAGCSEDPPGGAGGAGGSGTAGSGGSATGGSAGAGGSGTGGATGSGGSSGATGTGGSAGSGGSTGGAAGSGATGGSGGATGGSAGSAGATGGSAGKGGSAGSAGATGGTAGSSGAAGSGGSPDGGTANPNMSFFVTSETSKTGNLGGLVGADARCQRLAAAVGLGSKTWRAYLSADPADGGPAVNAKDRIGPGPYINAKGAMLAADSAALHARSGDADLFITEKGAKVNGQWTGSPTPNEHDVLTGTMGNGNLVPGQTCLNWTSEAMANTAQIGHSDGLGPSMSMTPPLNSWNGSHVNGGCNDTAPKGGAGRFYCFVGQ